MLPSLQEQRERGRNMQKIISEGHAAIGALATETEGWVVSMAARPITNRLLLLALGLSKYPASPQSQNNYFKIEGERHKPA